MAQRGEPLTAGLHGQLTTPWHRSRPDDVPTWQRPPERGVTADHREPVLHPQYPDIAIIVLLDHDPPEGDQCPWTSGYEITIR